MTECGAVYAVGENTHGQLGLGHRDNMCILTKITTLQNVIQVAVNMNRSFFLTKNGKVLTSGENRSIAFSLKPEEVPGLPEAIAQIVTSENDVYAISEYGRVYAWGANNNGQLGLGSKHAVDHPARVHGIPGKVVQIRRILV